MRLRPLAEPGGKFVYKAAEESENGEMSTVSGRKSACGVQFLGLKNKCEKSQNNA